MLALTMAGTREFLDLMDRLGTGKIPVHLERLAAEVLYTRLTGHPLDLAEVQRETRKSDNENTALLYLVMRAAVEGDNKDYRAATERGDTRS